LTRYLISVKRDLISVKRDLISVKRDIIRRKERSSFLYSHSCDRVLVKTRRRKRRGGGGGRRRRGGGGGGGGREEQSDGWDGVGKQGLLTPKGFHGGGAKQKHPG
jgi:hypothetical protein